MDGSLVHLVSLEDDDVVRVSRVGLWWVMAMVLVNFQRGTRKAKEVEVLEGGEASKIVRVIIIKKCFDNCQICTC